MDISTIRRLLQLPFESFYSHEFDTSTRMIPSIMLIVIEFILLAIALIQLLRFCHSSNIFIKKIIHMLIACQLIASIALELDISKLLGVNFPPYILFSIQEATFLFSALAYFTILLFWVDFNKKIRNPGPGIKFLQTYTFAFLVFGFAICYLCGFVAFSYLNVSSQHVGWTLSFKVIWWHLAYFCTITPLQLYYSFRIHRSLDKYYLSYSHSLSKTKKILNAVNFCFLLRACSIITFVILYYFSNNNAEVFLATWPAFLCFYILDQILPASIFMFLLRKSPKDHSLSESKLAFLSTNSSFDSGSHYSLSSGNCRR